MASSKRNQFYAVAGVNGRGVYDHYDKVKESSRYIACFKCKKFNDFEDAKSAAENMYGDLQGDNIFDYTVSEIRKINFFYYRKKRED